MEGYINKYLKIPPTIPGNDLNSNWVSGSDPLECSLNDIFYCMHSTNHNSNQVSRPLDRKGGIRVLGPMYAQLFCSSCLSKFSVEPAKVHCRSTAFACIWNLNAIHSASFPISYKKRELDLSASSRWRMEKGTSSARSMHLIQTTNSQNIKKNSASSQHSSQT